MSGKDPEPAGYAALLARLKTEVRTAQAQAKRAANTTLLELYWTIGSEIIAQQQQQGWGAKVIDRLARDLRFEFPDMRGLNRSNLYSMRAFAAAWPDRSIVPTVLGQLSWGHVRCLLDRLDDPSDRAWYATEATERGWTLAVLEHQIVTGLRNRVAAAPSNFADQLPVADSDLAQQLTRDPYVFEFLDLTAPALERDIEQALIDRLQETLLEFGRGFTFAGRQVHLDVDGEAFFVDLLLFHVHQLRFIRTSRGRLAFGDRVRLVLPELLEESRRVGPALPRAAGPRQLGEWLACRSRNAPATAGGGRCPRRCRPSV